MLARTLGPLLVRDAGYYPVVTLTGPRQSGKTTLARTTFPDFEYVNLEDTGRDYQRRHGIDVRPWFAI